KRAQLLQLVQPLDPLGTDIQIEGIREGHYRVDHGRVAWVLAQSGHIGAIDLDRIDRAVPQVTETRVPRAKVVNREPDTEVTQAVHRRHRRFEVAQRYALGNLQAEQRR